MIKNGSKLKTSGKGEAQGIQDKLLTQHNVHWAQLFEYCILSIGAYGVT